MNNRMNHLPITWGKVGKIDSHLNVQKNLHKNKKYKGLQNGEEEAKLSLFSENMILYMTPPKMDDLVYDSSTKW